MAVYNNSQMISTQNQTNKAESDKICYFDSLPKELLLTIFSQQNIEQVFNYCILNKKCKKLVEDDEFDTFFKQVKIDLGINSGIGSNKFIVFSHIKVQKEVAKKEKENIKSLTEIIKSSEKVTLETESIMKALNGLKAHLCLLKVGQSTWETVKEYLYVLTNHHVTSRYKIDKETERTFESWNKLMVDSEALHHHLLDDAKEIYEVASKVAERIFDLPFFLSLPVSYFINNDQFAEAEQFCAKYDIIDPKYALFLLNICKGLHKDKNYARAKWIASNALPTLEKRSLDNVKERYFACKSLAYAFDIHLLNNDTQIVHDYLFKHPVLARVMIDWHNHKWRYKDDDKLLSDQLAPHVNKFCRLHHLRSIAEKGNSKLNELTQKLNRNIGLKRSYPFDSNPFDDKSESLYTVLQSLCANLELLEHGWVNWSDVTKYIPVVIKGSYATRKVANYFDILRDTVKAALARHCIDDAIFIYNEGNWSLSSSNKILLYNEIKTYLDHNQETDKLKNIKAPD